MIGGHEVSRSQGDWQLLGVGVSLNKRHQILYRWDDSRGVRFKLTREESNSQMTHTWWYIYLASLTREKFSSRTNAPVIPMPRLPEFPLTITIPSHHQRLLRELREDTYNILSLDPVTRELVKLHQQTSNYKCSICRAVQCFIDFQFLDSTS